jgi:hypothetical protein
MTLCVAIATNTLISNTLLDVNDVCPSSIHESRHHDSLLYNDDSYGNFPSICSC